MIPSPEETMDRPRVYGNFINGAWTEGSGEYANTNPSDTRDVIGRYARATPGWGPTIPPWNFPIAIPAWEIAPALCYGNTVLFKPAELVPGSAWALAEILSRCGLPAGVFNLVMGKSSEIGEALLSDPRIAAVSFPGSPAIGRTGAQAAMREKM